MLWRMLALSFLATVAVSTTIVMNSYSGTLPALSLGALVAIAGFKILRELMFGLWDDLDDH